MVLEEINTEWLMERPYVSFFLGFIYSIMGYILGTLFFFEQGVSIAMLFLTTLFVVPTFVGVLSLEEKRERAERPTNILTFFKNHRSIVIIYTLVFLGAFVGFVTLGVLAQDQVPVIFEYQLDFLSKQEHINTDVLDRFFSKSTAPTVDNALSVLQHNLSVALIAFFLSVVFGAGALFLIVLNASVFASFAVLMIRYLSSNFAKAVQLIAVFSLHLIPEMMGFIIAAIAGGVMSKAILVEHVGTQEFKNVVHDSLYLFLIACVLILIAAFTEIFITVDLFTGL